MTLLLFENVLWKLLPVPEPVPSPWSLAAFVHTIENLPDAGSLGCEVHHIFVPVPIV